MPEMGEYLVGAYLREIVGCELVVYNQRLSRDKGEFGELDVLGLHSDEGKAYFCEVATHLVGNVGYGNQAESSKKIADKFKSAKEYAERAFPKIEKYFMFWAPKVSPGLLAKIKSTSNDLELKIRLVVNEEYSKTIQELRAKARQDARNTGDPFYRALQIIEHAVSI